MEIVRSQRKEIEVLTASGRVSIADVPRLTGEFQAVRAAATVKSPVRVVLDVTQLDNLPSAVVGSLVEAIRAVEATGGRMVLAGANHTLRVVLDRLGIAQLVTAYPSLDEALKALASTDGTNG